MRENNLDQISAAYEGGWNRLTEKYYAKIEWPEAETIAPLVNDGEHLTNRMYYLLTMLLQTQFS